MYGLVNKALQELVTTERGADTWTQVLQKAGVDIEVFVTHDAYPDDITYKMVGAASEILGRPASELLEAFGRHWVLQTAERHYGALMASGGRALGDFLRNLPNFHTRVNLMFPHLRPPVFRCDDVSPTSVRLTYISTRQGLTPFMEGLLHGLAERFKTPVTVQLVASRADGAEHDEFLVDWGTAA